MKYNTIFFDLDGTLLDYKKSESFALSKAFRESLSVSMPDDILSVYHRINSEKWAEYEKGLIDNESLRVQRFEELFAHYHFTTDPGIFSKQYLKNLSQGGWTLPGAKELLQKLAGKTRMAALTNGIGDVQRSRINLSGLGKFFETIVISDIVGFAKPDRRIFEYTLNEMGITSARGVLMVGDSLSSDIAGGINAGIDTCWYNPDGKECGDVAPVYTVSNLEEILKLLL